MITDILQSAITRIETGWCQGQFAENKSGEAVDVSSADAIAWCILGAIRADTNKIENGDIVFSRLHGEICTQINQPVPVWNDTAGRTKDDVLLVLRKVQEKFH